jgi:hypothetical protein
MNKKIIVFCLFASSILAAKAATTAAIDTGKVGTTASPSDPPLIFSGSVDTYYKYDFSGP